MKLKANAKINLCLNITGKREDGYHLIDSVMQSIDLFDVLTVLPAKKITVTCSKPQFSGEKNIAFSAARAFFETTGIDGGADIFIEKGIPDAGGLGGGSPDAAGVLIALNLIYKTALSTERLCEIGLKVGADVPFCVLGGAARVRGIGEILEPLPTECGLHFIIAKNGNKPSTAEMYRQIDLIKNPISPNTEEFAKAFSKGDFTKAAPYIGNTFQSVTGLFGIDEILKNTPYLALCLSGSGPCVFAAYKDPHDAKNALKLLHDKNVEAYKVTAQDSGIELISE